MAINIDGDGLIALGGTSTTQGRLRLAEDTDNGTNFIELTAPASVGSDRTITFPDATTTVVGTDATQTLTNKTLTTPNINSAQVDTVSGTAPLYFARAWVNFNGTGTVAIRASGNISTVADDGIGDYTVNFSTGIPGAAYALAGSCTGATDNGYVDVNETGRYLADSVRINCRVASSNAQQDAFIVSVTIFR